MQEMIKEIFGQVVEDIRDQVPEIARDVIKQVLLVVADFCEAVADNLDSEKE